MTLFLVTGGAGFIGSHLVDALLARGHGVRVLDDLSTGRRDNLDPRAEFLPGDVADHDAVRRAMEGAAGVFHLAAIASVQRSNEDWTGTHRANLSGTVAVLDAARGAGRLPVVYASSAAIYGDQGGGAIREDAPPRPQTAYGADKLGSELHALVGWSVHRLPSIGFRFFNVYGPRQDPLSPYSGVISIFARRALERARVTVNGDGRQSRDFVHVSDVVRGLVLAMDSLHREGRAEILNLCTGEATDLLALLDALGRVTGHRPEVAHGPARPGDIRASLGDPSRARHLLGWTVRTGLEDGLRTLVPPAGERQAA